MGIKALCSNTRKTFKSRKSTKWHRCLNAEKKKQLSTASVNIENVHLFSQEKLKNKLRNPKNNIKISGKKLRRLTKRLGHSLREKSHMDIEVPNTRSKSGRKNEAEDADMAEAEATGKLSDTLATTSSLQTSSKKKRRGGKKHKKKVSAGEVNEGKIFENDDGWEDVEMGEG